LTSDGADPVEGPGVVVVVVVVWRWMSLLRQSRYWRNVSTAYTSVAANPKNYNVSNNLALAD